MQQSQSACSSWLCRSQTESRSQLKKVWPQLSSQNETKHGIKKSQECCSILHQNDTNLDDIEYPYLGKRKLKCKNVTDSYSSYRDVTSELVSTHEKVKINHKKAASNRYKRRETICVDLQEALENAKYLKISGKRIKNMQIDIYNGKSADSDDRNSNEKGINLKRIKLQITKSKKPSKLKKTILLERQTKIAAEKQKTIDNKFEENITDIDSINLNTLKIIADPEIDVDYVKHMSALTFYGIDYRNVNQENITENTVQYRPDVLEKLDNLTISNVNNRNISTAAYKITDSSFNDIIDIDALQQTLSLQNDNVDKKPSINNVFGNSEIKYSTKFREYCNNMITPTLNESLDKFLGEIKRLQIKLYEKNPNKGKYKRRYYSGLKEVQKRITLNKIKFVVIAPDIEKIQSKGGLDEEVNKLLEICRKHEIVYCFGLRRRKLGYYIHGNGFVTCIGVANYSSCEELFRNVLIEVIHARNKFKELSNESTKITDLSNILDEDGLLSDHINNLFKILTSQVFKVPEEIRY